MPRKNKQPLQRSAPRQLPCAHKRRYRSEREALEVADYQMVLKPSVQLGVYLCPHCGSWHLTNIGKK